MNRYPRFLAVIAAVVFICTLVLGITGIYTEYGDVRTAIAYSVKDSSVGTGLGSGILITFLCPEGTEPSSEEISSVCSIMEKRLQTYGIKDANVYYDTNMSVFAVEAAYTGRSGYDPNILYKYLGRIGRITVRAGNERDDDGKPSGTTAETVLGEGKDIKKVSFSVDESSSTTRYICDIKFGGDSKEKIKDHTEEVMQADTNTAKYYSVWMDDSYITGRTFTSVIKNGVVPGGSVVYTDELVDDYIGLRVIAGTGELPFELTGAYVYNLSDPDNAVRFNGALILLLVEAAVFAVIAIVRYRLAGLGAAIGMAGYLGAVCIILSGGLSADLGLYVTRTKLYVLAAVTAVFAFVMLSLLERFTQSLGSSTAYRAAKDVFSSAEKRGALLLAALIIVTIAADLLSYAVTGLLPMYEALLAVSLFAAAGFVCVILGSACIIKSMASTRKLNDEKLYGGASA
ncbi:MAG: hypothetical protein IKX27_06820 [Oscillospiraceae bacterium]|nr:hypothetical protein [Oscillospiraceae bacterium]MBR5045446.1 hypothetical protein [Oscillospiraceae bacterium]MBR5071591.1 hypothetical protein [Oscillospiraceae bacterium]